MLFIGLVYAIGYIWSSEISVKVIEASVSLERKPVGDVLRYSNITFYGQVIKDGIPLANSNVTLFKDAVPVAWSLTNSTGYYKITWNATDVGTFVFQARAEV